MKMDLLILVVKANIVFVLLFAAYLMVMRRTTFFVMNRIWMLLAPLLAWTLPQLGSGLVQYGQVPLFVLPPVIASGGSSLAIASWSAAELVLTIYWVGVLFAFIALLRRYWLAWASIQCDTDQAFSLFNVVKVPQKFDEADARSIRLHESVHVRHGHSWDVLFYELCCVFSWWNPIWRSALKQLKLVHEFQADKIVHRATADYETLLIAHALGIPSNTLTNSFHSSTLKTRIMMIHKERSPRAAIFRYALILPLMFIGIAASAWHATEANVQDPVKQKLDKMPVFKGGNEAMFAYILEHVQYPVEAKKAGLEGKVFIEFIVRSDGRIENVTVKKSSDPVLSAEALRVVGTMPIWDPGMKDGEAVDAYMVLPIVFKLND